MSGSRPVRVALIDNFEVSVAGVRSLLTPYSARVALLDLGSAMTKPSSVDVILYEPVRQTPSSQAMLRDLARSGRLARLQIVLQDRPGALFRVMSEFHAHNVNIIEIYHQRIFTTLPAKGLTAEIECEARDGEQIDRLVDNLRAKGYSVELAELA